MYGMSPTSILDTPETIFNNVQQQEFTKTDDIFVTLITYYCVEIPGWRIYAQRSTPQFGNTLWWKGGWIEQASGDLYPLEEVAACYLFKKIECIWHKEHPVLTKTKAVIKSINPSKPTWAQIASGSTKNA